MKDPNPETTKDKIPVAQLAQLAQVNLSAEEVTDLERLLENSRQGLEALRRIPLSDTEPSTHFLPE